MTGAKKFVRQTIRDIIDELGDESVSGCNGRRRRSRRVATAPLPPPKVRRRERRAPSSESSEDASVNILLLPAHDEAMRSAT